MKCIILAAGYATRLYPLTENFPKPLLDVKGKAILDWLIDDINAHGCTDGYIVVSNHKFVHHFEKWAKTRDENITVLDDGTSSNENRLGAVRDIQYAIDKCSLSGDLLVIAGDNLLDFSLGRFIDYAREKGASAIMRYYEGDNDRLKKCGVVTVDENDLVLDMTEKPKEPKSNWCTPPFYYYTENDARLVGEGIRNGCGVDAPGSFVAWLAERRPVYAMQMPGKRYDIGNMESYNKVKEEYVGYADTKR